MQEHAYKQQYELHETQMERYQALETRVDDLLEKVLALRNLVMQVKPKAAKIVEPESLD